MVMGVVYTFVIEIIEIILHPYFMSKHLNTKSKNIISPEILEDQKKAQRFSTSHKHIPFM